MLLGTYVQLLILLPYENDDNAIFDNGYFASDSTNRTLFLVFLSSPWCFTRNAYLTDINAYILVLTKTFYGVEVASFNVMGTSCSLF